MNGAAESLAAQRRRQRRVPSESRKRNAQSCDRCRKRRCKCVPSWAGTGCQTCHELGIPCSYSTPRKTRFYGSVDDLSDRIRCLEAVVKGAFPNDCITTAEDVLHLGQRMGYVMPDLNDEARQFLRLEDMVRRPSGLGTTQNSHPNNPLPGASLSQTNTASVPTRTRSSSEDPQLSLVKDTAGHEHYIGPSGTLSFLSQLRKLVNQNASTVQAVDSEGVAEFIKDQTVQALEAEDDCEKDAADNATIPGDSCGPDRPSPGSITSAIARDFTRLPSASMQEILNQFPPDDALELLTSAYFKNVHDDFPLFHRATFEEEFELFITRARRWPRLGNVGDRPLPDWGWIGCLHMIIVFGSISQPKIPDVDHAALRRRCVSTTRLLLPQFVAKCTLNNVRVLLLLSLFLHNNNERNAAWNLVGTATRISFALGIHRTEMGSSFRLIERETRKRVFCTLYGFEQFLAASLGRPSGIQEIEVDAVPPREGFLDGSGGSTDSNLISMSLRLQGILSRTRLLYLGKRSTILAPGDLPTTEAVLNAVKEWKQDLSQHHGFDLPWITTPGVEDQVNQGMPLNGLKESLAWRTRSQLRAVLLLHIQYHYIILTVTRPQLLRGVASVRKGMSGPSENLLGIPAEAELCVKHAFQLGYLVILLDYFEVINGLWGFDIFYAYCAAMVLILRLFHSKTSGLQDGRQGVCEHSLEREGRELVGSLKDVMKRTDKSGSMRRFSQVVETFSRCIERHDSCLAESPSQIQNHAGRDQSLQQLITGDRTMASAAPIGSISFLPYGVQESVDNMAGFLPLPTLTSADLVREGEDGFAAPSWMEMEMFFAGYGVQG